MIPLRVVLALSAMVCISLGTARADKIICRQGKPCRLPSGLDLKTSERGGVLLVGRDGRYGKLPLPDRAYTLDRVALSSDARRLLIRWEDGCTRPHDSEFTMAQVDAIAENASAFRLHREKKYAEAAAGFAAALKLDPDFDDAAFNLASALVLQGRRDDAVLVLGGRLAKNPANVYARLLEDPEIAPLLDAPAVRSLRTPEKGTGFEQSVFRSDHWIGVSPSHDLIAILSYEDLLVFDTKRATRVATLSLAKAEDVDEEGEILVDARARIAERIRAANRFLVDLGFSPPKGAESGEEVKEENVRDTVVTSISLPKAKLTLSLDDARGRLRLKQGATIVASMDGVGEIPSVLRWVAYAPSMKALVFQWHRTSGSDDCGMREDIEALVVPPVVRSKAGKKP